MTGEATFGAERSEVSLTVTGRLARHAVAGLPAVAVCVLVAALWAPLGAVGRVSLAQLLLVAPVLAGYRISAGSGWAYLIAVTAAHAAICWGAGRDALPTVGFLAVGALVVSLVAGARRRIVSLEAAGGGARFDGLTGLLRVRAFTELCEHELAQSRRLGRPIAVLLIDVDSFMELVAEFGATVADATLRQLSELLRTQTRESDILARVGGDEFMILLPSCGSEDAIRRAEHIRSLVERTAAEWEHRMTVSVGAAVLPANAASLEELFAVVGDARTRAKADGRNRVAAAPAVASEWP